jgi:hypothetical protein
MGLYEKRLQVKPLQKLLDLDRTEPDPEEWVVPLDAAPCNLRARSLRVSCPVCKHDQGSDAGALLSWVALLFWRISFPAQDYIGSSPTEKDNSVVTKEPVRWF